MTDFAGPHAYGGPEALASNGRIHDRIVTALGLE